MTLLTVLLAPGGCTSDPAADSSDEDSAAVSDSDPNEDVDRDQLNGVVPDDPVTVPEFAATNRDGSARDRSHLLGHVTVMWFYPMAATAG